MCAHTWNIGKRVIRADLQRALSVLPPASEFHTAYKSGARVAYLARRQNPLNAGPSQYTNAHQGAQVSREERLPRWRRTRHDVRPKGRPFQSCSREAVRRYGAFRGACLVQYWTLPKVGTVNKRRGQPGPAYGLIRFGVAHAFTLMVGFQLVRALDPGECHLVEEGLVSVVTHDPRQTQALGCFFCSHSSAVGIPAPPPTKYRLAFSQRRLFN